MATTCVNHPTKQAAARCRKCQAGLCILCRTTTMPDGGVYCSDACWQAFREFQQRVDTGTGSRTRGRISFLGALRTLIIATVLVAFIWGVLAFWLGTPDPGQMLVELKRMGKVLF